MAEPELIERRQSSRGELVLRRRGEVFEIISNGVFLMDTRDGRSERLLVRAALDAATAPGTVLIGGLGVGFSLLEALADRRVARVVVVEIEPAVLDWHRSHLAEVSGGGLADPRVEVVAGDLVEILRGDPTRYDVICVDIDNGPDWLVSESNGPLYAEAGTALVVSRLADHGVMSVWGASPAPGYEALLRRELDEVRCLRVPVRRGEPDVVWVGRRRAG